MAAGNEGFFLLIFAYAVSDLFTYYYLFEKVSDRVICAMITVSDSMLTIMAGAWLYLLADMSKLDGTVTCKRVAGFTAAYLLVQEGLSCLAGSYRADGIWIDSVAGRNFIQALCVLYTALNLFLAAVCIRKILSEGGMRTLNLIFFICFALSISITVYFAERDPLKFAARTSPQRRRCNVSRISMR